MSSKSLIVVSPSGLGQLGLHPFLKCRCAPTVCLHAELLGGFGNKVSLPFGGSIRAWTFTVARKPRKDFRCRAIAVLDTPTRLVVSHDLAHALDRFLKWVHH